MRTFTRARAFLRSLDAGADPETAALAARLSTTADPDEYPLPVSLWAALDQGDHELAEAILEST